MDRIEAQREINEMIKRRRKCLRALLSERALMIGSASLDLASGGYTSLDDYADSVVELFAALENEGWVICPPLRPPSE